jgi:two-component system LytT family sensor kinase
MLAFGVIAGLMAVVSLGWRTWACLVRRPDKEHVSHTTLRAARLAGAALYAGDAKRAARDLVDLLRVPAVAISDKYGVLLVGDGGASHHYFDVEDLIVAAISTGTMQTLGQVRCADRRCPVRCAAVVPLLVEGQVRAVITVCVGSGAARVMRTIGAVAALAATYLELARLDEYKAELAAAEVRAHRAQISPHFIYNALTAIASMVRTDPKQACELLQDFADFVEYSFGGQGHFATLTEELSSIDHYLTLERARFGSRLTVTLAIAPETLPVVIPFLCLQPLVENALHHGMVEERGTCHITIVAQDYCSEVLISVEDDGAGMNPEDLFNVLKPNSGGGIAFESDGPRSGIALRNISERLRLVYGEEYGLIVETAQGAGMKVIMKVPKFRVGVYPPFRGYARPMSSRNERNA